jgi:hypothetical protein
MRANFSAKRPFGELAFGETYRNPHISLTFFPARYKAFSSM